MCSKHFPADKMRCLPKSDMWMKVEDLMNLHNPLRLGVGYPDFAPPKLLLDEATKSVSADNPIMHQYARGYGHVRLVKAVAKLFSSLIGREIDHLDEVLITPGTDFAIQNILQCFLNPFEEVIVFEPYFEKYKTIIELSRGVPRFVTLTSNSKEESFQSSNDWTFDIDQLESMFNEKTKLVLLNTPLNPIGKVFTQDEMSKIAELCIKYDVLCITDEVYQWFVYDDAKHIRMASLPGMWERTITTGSAGKSFGVTGWKISWTLAPKYLMSYLQPTSATVCFSANKPIQEAIAVAIEHEILSWDTDKSFFCTISNVLKTKRNRLAKVLKKIGLIPIIPEGGFFLVADVSKIKVPISSGDVNESSDFKFVKWFISERKISAIPVSPFYSPGHKNLGHNYVRFCFAKADTTFDKLEEITENWLDNNLQTK